eukprot:TRINITY_DN8481_c0_g2_i4.p1 TRINITY_DN8481_c0_g2~~TRINITY_DN8481_c0_g2_i4.p1  ORF type:complete len:385 (+),score=122.55 TRINITY_DN8481_c0_g2_i4:210-1364(+)
MQIDKHIEGLDEAANADKLKGEYEAGKKSISVLKNKLALALNEKRDIETEFMSLKKNYIEKCKELEDEKSEVDKLKLQIIKGDTQLHGSNAEYGAKVKSDTVIEMELEKAKKQLEEVRSDLNKARNDKANMELYTTKLKLEIENKGLQSGFVGNGRVEELLEWKTRCKRLERDIEELNLDMKDVGGEKERLEETNGLLAKELESVKKAYRRDLSNAAGAKAEELLVKSLADGEQQLRKLIQNLSVKYANQRKICLFLRKRSAQLKNICEDLIPKGGIRLSILDEEEPSIDIDDGNTFLVQFREYDNLRKGYEQLKLENQVLKARSEEYKAPDEVVQQRILEELQALRAKSSLPTAEDYEKLKRERISLLEETRRLKIIVTRSKL